MNESGPAARSPTPEEQIRDAFTLGGCEHCMGDEVWLVVDEAELTAGIRAALAARDAEVLTIIARARQFYDESIFAPDGASLESKSAKWARNLLDGITEDIRALSEGKP